MKSFKILGNVLGGMLNIIIFAVAIFAMYKVTISAYEMGFDYFTVESSESSKEIAVKIPEGSSVSDVGNLLEKEGLIKNSIFFQVESYLVGSKSAYEGGEYTLDTSMTSNDIRSLLREPTNIETEEIRVTLREGLTIKEIGEVLESKSIVTKEEFIEACNTEEFDYFFLKEIPERENRLEGYLFPDTYLFLENTPPRQVIVKMLDRFSEIYTDEFITRTAELDLTIDDVITIASIIEKEVRVPEERAKVASVIYNRLGSGMKLQMCSSVLYVLDVRKERLLDADIQINSPYNTYVNTGLPIGPIASPGEACIAATLYPDETNYVYFVVKDESTGEHVFTNDYNEFLKAKSDYNQKF